MFLKGSLTFFFFFWLGLLLWTHQWEIYFCCSLATNNSLFPIKCGNLNLWYLVFAISTNVRKDFSFWISAEATQCFRWPCKETPFCLLNVKKPVEVTSRKHGFRRTKYFPKSALTLSKECFTQSMVKMKALLSSCAPPHFSCE